MKIKIRKLRELPDAMHPHNIEVGFENIIEFSENIIIKPEIGERFPICSYWSTSVVTEIINENTFKTLNSIYHWEVEEEEKKTEEELEKEWDKKEKAIDLEINKGIWFGEEKKEDIKQIGIETFNNLIKKHENLNQEFRAAVDKYWKIVNE